MRRSRLTDTAGEGHANATGRPVIDTRWLAATLALALVPAACKSPFEGESQRPKSDSGWQLDQDKEIPTQEQLDLQDEGFDDD